MSLVDLKPYYSNFQTWNGYTREFVLQFKPTNPFISARIATDFQFVVSCQVTKGLKDLGLDDDSVCTPESNIMFLTNFDTYLRSDFENDYVEIRFIAIIRTYAIATTAEV